MEGDEASAENGSHHNNPENIYVELNNQPSELLQTVKELKDELQTVEVDNANNFGTRSHFTRQNTQPR